MNDADDGEPPTGRVELGYLASDLSFVSRVLRAHIRAMNADFYRENEAVSGSVALLSLIGLNPGISQNDLAAAVVIKKSAVTKIVTGMEEGGLVRRRKSHVDRRFNALELTDKGEARWRQLRDEMLRQQDRLLAPLDVADRETLFMLLGRLLDHYGSDEAGAGGHSARRADAAASAEGGISAAARPWRRRTAAGSGPGSPQRIA